MTNLKDKIKNLGSWIKENPKKTIAGLGLAGLIATTALKDNVHFGSVMLGPITINNYQENHYIWGLAPRTIITGDKAKGNFYTFGLLYGINEIGDNSEINGNMNVYSLFGSKNDLGKNSKINGDMNAYGLVGGGNVMKENSEITGNLRNRGILVYNPINEIGFVSNDVKNLKNYVYKVEVKK